jgi:hypothetical protein
MKSPEQVPSSNGKLTNNEALLYQTYATQVEGKKFDEQASPEAYGEAEKLLRQFQDPKFDWLGVDWDKVDFKNLKDVEDVEERVRFAASFLLTEAQSKNPDLFEKLVIMLGGEEKAADRIIETAQFTSLAVMVLSYFAGTAVGGELGSVAGGTGSAAGLLGVFGLESPELKIEIRSFIRKHMGSNE